MIRSICEDLWHSLVMLSVPIPGYAGITLTGYHPPPPPQHSVASAPKCVTSPRAFVLQKKCLGAGPINDDVPVAGHLHQHKEC